MVAALSSMARIPFGPATIAWAVAVRSCVVMRHPAPLTSAVRSSAAVQEGGDAGKRAALEELEGGATTGAEVGDVVGDAEGLQGRGEVAAPDEACRPAGGQCLGHPPGPAAELRDLVYAERADPH